MVGASQGSATAGKALAMAKVARIIDDLTGQTVSESGSYAISFGPVNPKTGKAFADKLETVTVDLADNTAAALTAFLAAIREVSEANGTANPDTLNTPRVNFGMLFPKSPVRPGSKATDSDSAKIRAWAKEQIKNGAEIAKSWGEVGDNGKIKDEIKAAYYASQASENSSDGNGENS